MLQSIGASRGGSVLIWEWAEGCGYWWPGRLGQMVWMWEERYGQAGWGRGPGSG